MSSSKNPSSSANQDDPWEQIAEDLFGLQYGKEHASREPAPPAAEAVPPPAPATHPASGRSRDEFVPDVSIPAEEPPRFAAAGEPDLTLEESEEPESFNESAVADDESAAAGAAPEVAPSTPTSPQDSYWDALANWNWNESEGGGGKSRSEHRRSDGPRSDGPRSDGPRADRGRSGGGPPPRGGSRGRDETRGRRGDVRSQRESASSPPAPANLPPAPPVRSSRQPEPPASDDFGLGLAAEAPGFSPPAETSGDQQHPTGSVRDLDSSSSGATPQASTQSVPARGEGRGGERGGTRPGEQRAEAGGEGEFPRKRRRRRRRRRGGRGAEGEPGSSPSAAPVVPGDDWDDSAGPEADLPEDETEPAVEAAEGGSAGEVVAETPAPEARSRRPGRHDEDRRPRSFSDRGAARFDEDEEEEPQEMITAGGGAGEPELESGAESGDDESGEEQIVNFEDVPTWEEAISYLLHPNQVQVEPGAGGGGSNPPRSAPPADQPRQTRHIGHRKHRR